MQEEAQGAGEAKRGVVAVTGGERGDAGVRDLCLAVEQACLHGIKTQVGGMW